MDGQADEMVDRWMGKQMRWCTGDGQADEIVDRWMGRQMRWWAGGWAGR